ncbi:MAG: rane protein [Solimicrobium sp.]|jgi:predicted lipid-binding transport protein (Tim44 family)|nr:rane protein [Solimicrobium sp.]
MNKFLVILATVIGFLLLVTSVSEAKRMGGSRSFGKQSSNVTGQQAPAQPLGNNLAKPASSTTATPAGAAQPTSPWKNMLGGALLGLGLGALLSGLGLSAGMSNIISVLLMAGIGIALVMFLMRLFKQRGSPGPVLNNAYASSTQFTTTPEIGSRLVRAKGDENSDQSSVADSARNLAGANPGMSGVTWEIPSDFDVAQFERTAQTYFIRLQAAWDKADIDDIFEFTTPEMFAELKLQILERGSTLSVTDVITIHAKLLGIETQASTYLASVKFVGTMKEEVDAPTISFEEIWNLSKPITGPEGWLLAGIQQVD